jgi:hypothetical protein
MPSTRKSIEFDRPKTPKEVKGENRLDALKGEAKEAALDGVKNNQPGASAQEQIGGASAQEQLRGGAGRLRTPAEAGANLFSSENRALRRQELDDPNQQQRDAQQKKLDEAKRLEKRWNRKKGGKRGDGRLTNRRRRRLEATEEKRLEVKERKTEKRDLGTREVREGDKTQEGDAAKKQQAWLKENISHLTPERQVTFTDMLGKIQEKNEGVQLKKAEIKQKEADEEADKKNKNAFGVEVNGGGFLPLVIGSLEQQAGHSAAEGSAAALS